MDEQCVVKEGVVLGWFEGKLQAARNGRPLGKFPADVELSVGSRGRQHMPGVGKLFEDGAIPIPVNHPGLQPLSRGVKILPKKPHE